MISLGGSSGQSSQQQSAQQGFRDLPPEIQNAFKDLATQAQGFLPGNNGATTQAFTPMAQTAGETQAYGAINQGFTPTASSINSDIAMQQNPYDHYVIDEINRQAQGSNSVLQQNLSRAGQFGSNRGMLGANDIDLTRLGQIGQFQQGQFNTNLNNALTTLPQLRASTAQSQLAAGQAQRGLSSQTAQAPINALAAISQILGVLPTNSGQSSGSGNSSQSGFSFGFSPFSDIALKENIRPVGRENGFPIYEFNYIGQPQKYIGVMAQEVERIAPEAVGEREGYKTVDYDMIGVKFREAA